METTIAKLFVHGPRSTRPEDGEPTPMEQVDAVEAIVERGLKEDARYFRRVAVGEDRKRQVSLIDEATIVRHEAVFGPIPSENVKSQIVLAGELDLPALVGAVLRFESGAELEITLARKPCYAMDLIYPGLREAMEDGNQGALARVVAAGALRVGDRVTVVTRELAAAG